MPPLGSIDSNNVEHVRDIKTAMAKGYRFIKLVHHQDGSITERVYPVEGVRVKRFYDQMTHTNKVSIDQRSDCGCFFVADRDTGIREAFLLDTPHNRRFLASHLMENRWRIADDGVQKEIEELAATMPVDVDTSRMHEDVNMGAVVRPTDMIKALPKEQREALLQKKRAELAELEQASQQPNEAVEEASSASSVSLETGNQTINDSIRHNLPKRAVDNATRVIHQKYASQIARMRREHGANFAKSEEYRRTILPEIDAMIAKELSPKPAEPVKVPSGEPAEQPKA